MNGWQSDAPGALPERVVMPSSELAVGSPGWMPQDACRGEDRELFFPVTAAGPALAQVFAAKVVCFPVRGTRRVPLLRPGHRAGRHLGRNHAGGTPRHAAVIRPPGPRAQRQPGVPECGGTPSRQSRRTVTRARRRTALTPAREGRASPARAGTRPRAPCHRSAMPRAASPARRSSLTRCPCTDRLREQHLAYLTGHPRAGA